MTSHPLATAADGHHGDDGKSDRDSLRTNAMKSNIEAALAELIANLRAHYGARAHAVYRIDHSRDVEDLDRADTEIVVLLADESWRGLDEHRALGELTFEAPMRHSVYIRGWPLPAKAWQDPGLAEHPGLVRDLRAHSEKLLVPT